MDISKRSTAEKNRRQKRGEDTSRDGVLVKRGRERQVRKRANGRSAHIIVPSSGLNILVGQQELWVGNVGTLLLQGIVLASCVFRPLQEYSSRLLFS